MALQEDLILVNANKELWMENKNYWASGKTRNATSGKRHIPARVCSSLPLQAMCVRRSSVFGLLADSPLLKEFGMHGDQSS